MRTNTIKVVDEEDIDVGDDCPEVAGAVVGEAVVAAEVVGAEGTGVCAT